LNATTATLYRPIALKKTVHSSLTAQFDDDDEEFIFHKEQWKLTYNKISNCGLEGCEKGQRPSMLATHNN